VPPSARNPQPNELAGSVAKQCVSDRRDLGEQPVDRIGLAAGHDVDGAMIAGG
jgi:hypothetical protein